MGHSKNSVLLILLCLPAINTKLLSRADRIYLSFCLPTIGHSNVQGCIPLLSVVSPSAVPEVKLPFSNTLIDGTPDDADDVGMHGEYNIILT